MNTTTLHFLILLMTSTFLLNSSNVKKGGLKESNQEKSEQIYPRLFLLSKGLTTDSLKAEFLRFLEKEPDTLSVAVVVNASSSDKKKIKKTRKIQIEFTSLGFDSSKIELFDLMKRPPQELLKFDIIYILGGNPFLLLDEVNKSDARSTLMKLAYQDKVLMGYSAGALLLGPDLTLMNHVDTLLGFNEDSLKELTCLNLYDFHIFPHYNDFTSQVPELIASIAEYELQSNLPVYRINDNQGIIYHRGNVRIIGK